MAKPAADDNFLPALQFEPKDVIKDPKKWETFFGMVKAETAKLVPDLSTATGRKAIASLSYKVARTKTAVDAARKELGADMRKQLKEIDEVGNKLVEQLQTLQDETRKPLTEWEETHEKREKAAAEIIERLRDGFEVTLNHTPEAVDDMIAQVAAMVIDPSLFDDEGKLANLLRDSRLSLLRQAKDSLLAQRAMAEQQRAMQAELAAMRAELAAARAAQQSDARGATAAEAEARAQEDKTAPEVALDPRQVALKALVEAADDEELSVAVQLDEEGREVFFDRDTGEILEDLVDPALSFDGAIRELETHQTQLDADGVRVGVSREALSIVLMSFAGVGPTPAPSSLSETFVEEAATEMGKAMGVFYQRLQPDGGDDLTQADMKRGARAVIELVIKAWGAR